MAGTRLQLAQHEGHPVEYTRAITRLVWDYRGALLLMFRLLTRGQIRDTMMRMRRQGDNMSDDTPTVTPITPIPLQSAYLCVECNFIADCATVCPKCLSVAVLSVAKCVDRAIDSHLMEVENALTEELDKWIKPIFVAGNGWGNA